ncbi:hypothetical protein [Amycolatopsis anabasis]|uniref:hypothetical protein n=1 Tax=Amycolatopsis anabasis TaxID=1840409 RepID=UPI00131A6BDE|nr:hypothetical protein [Amycolatopsis anabasis]
MRRRFSALALFGVSGLALATSGLGAGPAQAVAAPQCSAAEHCYAVGFIGSKEQPLWMNAVGSDLGVGCLHVDDRETEFANWEMWLLTNLNNPALDTWVEVGMTAGKLHFSPGQEKGFLWYWADQRPGLPYREAYIKPARTLDRENVTFNWVPNSPNWEIHQDGDLVGVSENNGAWGGQVDNGLEVTTPGARIAAGSINFQYQDTNNVWHPADTELYNDRPDLFSIFTNGRVITAATHKPCNDETVTMPTDNKATPPTPSMLLETATRLAAANGEEHPANIQYVATDRQALTSIDGTRPKSNDPVYLVQMTGNFVGYAASVPRGSKPPKGNVLTATVDANTGQMLSWSILLTPHDLSQFGTAATLR